MRQSGKLKSRAEQKFVGKKPVFKYLWRQKSKQTWRHAIDAEKKSMKEFENVNDSNNSNPEYGYDTDTYSFEYNSDDLQ